MPVGRVSCASQPPPSVIHSEISVRGTIIVEYFTSILEFYFLSVYYVYDMNVIIYLFRMAKWMASITKETKTLGGQLSQ